MSAFLDQKYAKKYWKIALQIHLNKALHMQSSRKEKNAVLKPRNTNEFLKCFHIFPQYN